MVIVAWIVVGLVAGAVAGQTASCAKLGVFGNIALAITGAVLAGVLVDSWAGGVQVTHVQYWSMFTSMTAVVVALVAHDERFRRLVPAEGTLRRESPRARRSQPGLDVAETRSRSQRR